MVHVLKLETPWFQVVQDGLKTFELRRDDRDFQVGDYLDLLHYFASIDSYDGQRIRREIIWACREMPGLAPGFVALSLGPVVYR